MILSKSLVLFHLAAMDRTLLEERLAERGVLQAASYAGHARKRFSQFDSIRKFDPIPLDDVSEILRQKIAYDDNGQPAATPRFSRIMGRRSLNVLVPERFSDLLWVPAAAS